MLAGLVGAFALATPARSDAAFVAWICNDAACAGMDDFSVADNAGGDILNGINGAILWTTSAFGYDITTNQAQSKPALAQGMDLNYTVTRLALNPGDPGAIWLYAVDTDFAGPQTLMGNLGGTRDSGPTTAIICNGDANSNDFAPCATSSVGAGSGAFTLSVPFSATANPYALAVGVSIDLTGPGTATGDFRVVPEPAMIGLFGLGLAGLAAYRRRRVVA